MRTLGIISTVLLIVACQQDGIQPQLVPLVEIVAGDAQTDTVGKTLPVQLAAALTDKESGAPLPGRILNWSVAAGAGEVFVTVTQTGSDGVARNQWTLGPAAGGQKLVARYIDPETGEPVTLDTAFATALPGGAATFHARRPDDRVQVYVGDTVTVLYSYSDAHGNPTWVCVGGANPDSIGWQTEKVAVLRPLGTARRTAEEIGFTQYVAEGTGISALSAVQRCASTYNDIWVFADVSVATPEP